MSRGHGRRPATMTAGSARADLHEEIGTPWIFHGPEPMAVERQEIARNSAPTYRRCLCLCPAARALAVNHDRAVDLVEGLAHHPAPSWVQEMVDKSGGFTWA